MRPVILLLLCCWWLQGEDSAPTPLFTRVLSLQHIQEPEIDDQAMTTAFTDLVAKARQATAAATSPHERIAALNHILLTDRSVSYLSNQYWRDSTLAASLLRGKGNCLATSTLYVLVGDALGLPIHMVVIPGHAFVRWDDAALHCNIETTAGGREISTAEYLYHQQQCDPADVAALGWGTSLSTDGFLAELIECAARHRISQNRLAEPMPLQQEVERLVPTRSDLTLIHIQLRSDLSKDRTAATLAYTNLLDHGNPPPSVAVGALLGLAADAAARGDIPGERLLLLTALVHAPKNAMGGVLTQLAFCHRSMHDFRGARRYMELAVVLTHERSPELANQLYNLAILQKNDHDLEAALVTIRRAIALNPESWNLTMLEAGYTVLVGRRAEGLALRATVTAPRDDSEFWKIMQTWFLAVTGDRKKFLASMDATLAASNSQSILVWIEQDVDLDPYRSDPQFISMVALNRQRLAGAKPPPSHP